MNKVATRALQSSTALSRAGFHTTQLNGQRISINLRYIGQAEQIERLERNEVFVGHLPRDAFEDELLQRMQQAGRVYKIRWMMDFSGNTRGYGFVKYVTPDEAQIALRLLNNFCIRFNHDPIGAKISMDNKALFFGNLPITCTARVLVNALTKIEVQGIVGAIMDDQLLPRNRGYCDRRCFVLFQSHEAATKARRVLLPVEVKMSGRVLSIDWGRTDIPQWEVQNLPGFHSVSQNYRNHQNFNFSHSNTYTKSILPATDMYLCARGIY